jgi:hypothetical protein
MSRKFHTALALLSLFLIISSCKKDDDGLPPFQERDRADEAEIANKEILEFLNKHFYNYEDFENPPADFDYRIVFDTIGGENADKIPLIEQVQVKQIKDRVNPDVVYDLYYLVAKQGGGDTARFAGGALVNYQGLLLKNKNTFDESNNPIMFDLTSVIQGFQLGISTIHSAENYYENPDGTLTFENYGVGAVFVPSALGYWYSPPSSSIISAYTQLIFTYQVLEVVNDLDHDNDGIPSWMEDLNGNGYLLDDDTDGDGVPNYIDNDDDGDGVLTIDEIIVHPDGTIEFPDYNNDGTPDYLDPDYPY